MLEHFFRSSRHLSHLRQGPFVGAIDSIANKLHQLGYGRKYGRRILSIIGKFNRYALDLGIEIPTGIDESVVRRFIEDPAYRGWLVSVAMHHLRKYLCDQGMTLTTTSPDPYEPILQKYDGHLVNVRGLAVSSRTQSLHYARRFLIWLQRRHGEKVLDRLNGVDVLEYITESAERHPNGSWRNSLCSYTRVFLRYLRWQGIIHVDLDRVVPKVPQWRLRDIPRHLPWEQVRRLIESVDIAKPIGLRDRAILLLIATLGLRNQEVRSLQLTDIFWRTAEIRLEKTKTRRERRLPLPAEVGSAIAEYLLHGRPRVGTPEVFLRHFTPVGPITSTHGIGDIVEKHLLRAGIHASNHGAHLLRHSLATRMVNEAVPIKQIADVLGHTSINTTAIYTKVDTTRLAGVALPFPGGEA
jgi:integrase/recombinase XerD